MNGAATRRLKGRPNCISELSIFTLFRATNILLKEEKQRYVNCTFLGTCDLYTEFAAVFHGFLHRGKTHYFQCQLKWPTTDNLGCCGERRIGIGAIWSLQLHAGLEVCSYEVLSSSCEQAEWLVFSASDWTRWHFWLNTPGKNNRQAGGGKALFFASPGGAFLDLLQLITLLCFTLQIVQYCVPLTPLVMALTQMISRALTIFNLVWICVYPCVHFGLLVSTVQEPESTF